MWSEHVAGRGVAPLHRILLIAFESFISFGLLMSSYFVLWTVFQASAALARKKGKGLHKDMAIFWHKKKTSEFSVDLCTVSAALCARPSSFEWGGGGVGLPCNISLGSFVTSCHNYNITFSRKSKVQCRVTCDIINSVLTLVSLGPNKKPFSLKEKQPGDGEAGPGTEDTPFQHSPLGKPVARAAAGTLNKRCGWSFRMPVLQGKWVL